MSGVDQRAAPVEWDGAVRSGAQRMLDNYMGLREGEAIALVVPGADPILVDIVGSAAAAMGARATCVGSENYDEVAARFERVDVVAYLGTHRSLHGDRVVEWLRARSGPAPRFFRVFDLSEELLALCFNVPREELSALNRRVIATVSSAHVVRVWSSAGTDLEIKVQPEHAWTDAFGHFDGSYPGVLPPGEVATYSSRVSGELVCDGAINTNFGFPCDVRCADSPVRVTFNDSEAVHVDGRNRIVARLLEHFFTLDFTRRVGEVGFGTNHGITEFVPFVSHINERRSSLHIGVGSHQQSVSALGWRCPLHFDLILGDCSMYADGVLFHRDGRYLESALADGATLPDVEVLYADTV